MNYLLVTTEELDAQGYVYQYAERIPDGRVILPLTALKVLSNFTPTIIDEDSLKRLIKEQRNEGITDTDTDVEPTEGGTENGC